MLVDTVDIIRWEMLIKLIRREMTFTNVWAFNLLKALYYLVKLLRIRAFSIRQFCLWVVSRVHLIEY